MIIALLALASQAFGQVGPAIAPDTTNPAGDVELGVSGNVLQTMWGFSGHSDFRVQSGVGTHLDWNSSNWFTISGHLYGLVPVYANQKATTSSRHGTLGVDIGVPVGTARLGLWATAAGSEAMSEELHEVVDYGGTLGLSALVRDRTNRVQVDAHLSVLQCADFAPSSGELDLQCRTYDFVDSFGDWLLPTVLGSELGVDYIVNDRDSVRFALTSVVPTVGWKGRFDKVDVTVLWGSFLVGINYLQIRIDTHPLQWKHRHERDDPDSTWVERR